MHTFYVYSFDKCILPITQLLFFLRDRVSQCCPDWSAVAWLWHTAASTSWAQAGANFSNFCRDGVSLYCPPQFLNQSLKKLWAKTASSVWECCGRDWWVFTIQSGKWKDGNKFSAAHRTVNLLTEGFCTPISLWAHPTQARGKEIWVMPGEQGRDTCEQKLIKPWFWTLFACGVLIILKHFSSLTYSLNTTQGFN